VYRIFKDKIAFLLFKNTILIPCLNEFKEKIFSKNFPFSQKIFPKTHILDLP